MTQLPPSDRDEFIDLLRPHYNDALRFCISLSGGDPSREPQDILQDALVKALKNFPRLKQKESFRPWLFQIILRVHRSAYRLSLWKRFMPFGPHIDSIPSTNLAESQFAIKQELQQLLVVLPSKEKEAIVLFEIGGFSLEEVRRIQKDKSISAVKSRLKRARERLKQSAMTRNSDSTSRLTTEVRTTSD